MKCFLYSEWKPFSFNMAEHICIFNEMDQKIQINYLQWRIIVRLIFLILKIYCFKFHRKLHLWNLITLLSILNYSLRSCLLWNCEELSFKLTKMFISTQQSYFDQSTKNANSCNIKRIIIVLLPLYSKRTDLVKFKKCKSKSMFPLSQSQ